MVVQYETAKTLISLLTPKELELVRHIAHGHTARQTCRAMSINTGTYRSHKYRIKRKMNDLPMWGWPGVLFKSGKVRSYEQEETDSMPNVS